jgi:hypothetical protein
MIRHLLKCGCILAANQCRPEVHHYNSIKFLHGKQHIVRRITCSIAYRSRASMREEQRRFCGGNYVSHGLMRDVANVDQHSKPIHFEDYIFSKVSKTVVDWCWAARVRPTGMTGMS